MFPIPPVPDGSHGLDVLVGCFNYLYSGDRPSKFDYLTAAHRRVHSRLTQRLEALVMTDSSTMSQEATLDLLKHALHYEGQADVRPLGSRGGVPEAAADVGLAVHLETSFPMLAAQVR